MIKQIAWNTFKKTGDINTFLELKQIADIEQNIQKDNINIPLEGLQKQNIKAENYEIIKGKGIDNSRENSSRF